jgi:anti-anti-sigma factor
LTRPDDTLASPFALRVVFTPGRVVVVVHGEMDLVTAPELGSLLAGIADRDPRSVVLDLADCCFIDLAGLRVISKSAEHLALWGRTLSIRSPSGAVRRLLDLVGPAGVALVEGPETVPAAIGDIQASADAGRLALATGGVELLSVSGAALPGSIDHDGLESSLRLIVALARALVGGADGASVSLRRHDCLATVAASDGTVLAMDAEQYATGQGPCVDASTAGRRFHTDALDSETRWPAFAPKAQALGIKAIVSSPLLVRDRPVGALNIYSRTAEAFTRHDRDLASLFAAETSAVLSGVEAASTNRSDWFTEALETRQVTAVASAHPAPAERATWPEDFYG